MIVNVSCCFKIFFTQDIQYSACWLFLLLLVVKHFYISGYFSALLAILRNTVQASGLFGSALLDPRWFWLWSVWVCKSKFLGTKQTWRAQGFTCMCAWRARAFMCSRVWRARVVAWLRVCVLDMFSYFMFLRAHMFYMLVVLKYLTCFCACVLGILVSLIAFAWNAKRFAIGCVPVLFLSPVPGTSEL